MKQLREKDIQGEMEITRALSVAVVHDWIFTRRGGERVLEQILDLFPQADLYYLFGQPQKHLNLKNRHKFIPSFLAKIPFIQKIYKVLLPLLPIAIESFDLSGYDLIISSSSCVAKGIISSPSGVHISYIHSPMRYAWDQEHRYFKKSVTLWRPVELLRRVFLHRLRIWDVTSTVRIDRIIANSYFVARRCQLYYGRKAQVIYPPVDIDLITKGIKKIHNPSRKILLFGAWVPYKKMYEALELLIQNNIQVIAAGQGEELERAAKKFASKAEFCINPADAEIPLLYSRAHALLFPAIEDFGIIPVEALASGIWVVAPNQGGTSETVIDNITGFTFKEGRNDLLLAAVQKALAKEVSVSDKKNMLESVQKFSKENFAEKFSSLVKEALGHDIK